MKIIYRDKETNEEIIDNNGWLFIRDNELWACNFGSGNSDDTHMWAGEAWKVSDDFYIEVNNK